MNRFSSGVTKSTLRGCRTHCLLVCLLVAGCDPSEFHELSQPSSGAPDGGVGGAPEAGRAGRTSQAGAASLGSGGVRADAGAGAGGSRAPSAGGAGGGAGRGDGGSSARGGASGAAVGGRDGAAVGGMSGSAAIGGMSGSAAIGGMSGAAAMGGDGGNGGAAGAPPAAITCPKRPSGSADGFCYDFESGVAGPNAGDDYEFWYTPDAFTSTEISTEQWPATSSNDVLRVSPPLVGEFPSATLGRDLPSFARARIEFDFTANDVLVNAPDDVVWFRYVPKGDDFDRLTQLVFRAGQALVRAEGSGDYRMLQHLPRIDGGSTHVSLVLDRAGPCRVEVYFDGELVGSAPEAACIVSMQGFVEWGLVGLQPLPAPIHAYYDNIAVLFE